MKTNSTVIQIDFWDFRFIYLTQQTKMAGNYVSKIPAIPDTQYLIQQTLRVSQMGDTPSTTMTGPTLRILLIILRTLIMSFVK